MVQMTDGRMGQMPRIPPLPPFITPEELLGEVLPMVDPASRISVTDAAERYLRVPAQGNWQAYDRETTPYTVEPQDMTQSRRFKAVGFLGPSQSGKSQMHLSVSAHAVMAAPGPVQLVHMTKTDADAWVEEKLNPALENSPDLRDRLGRSRDDSTFQRKRFRGMTLTVSPPVANQLSSRTRRLMLLNDADHMPQRLGPKDAPEGSPFGMSLQRIRNYMSRGCVFAETSPAFPRDRKVEWQHDPVLAPHMLPPATAGLVLIYNEGTRGRWYWECPDCEGLFEPRIDRLRYDRALEPGAAARDAEMECPHCHSLLAHRHKVELNRRALRAHGGWLHEGRNLDEAGRRKLVRIDDAEIRDTLYATYSLNGAAAAFSTWFDIVMQYETARRRYEETGDDTEFARVHYTDIGVTYDRPEREEEGALTVRMLRDGATLATQRLAPSWVRFVTVSIDVQGAYFAVSVFGWGADGERILLDRYDISQPPDDAPRAKGHDGKYRAIDPGRYVEDAEVLLELADKVYSIEGTTWGLRPCALVIDFNGPKGWSDNAEKFWRKRRKEGQGARWFLSIGRGGFSQRDRVWHEAPERGSKGKKARGIKLLNMATDRLKDSVMAALGRVAEAVGRQHVPSWLEEERVAELLAEVRTDTGYEKRAPRNETLDHSVQALAVAEHKGLNRINWEAPPPWCVIGAENEFAVRLNAGGEEPPSRAAPEDVTPAKPAPRGISYLSRR